MIENILRTEWHMLTNRTFLTFFMMGAFLLIGLIAAIMAIVEGNRKADRDQRVGQNEH